MASVKKNFLFNVLLVISNIFFPMLVFPYIARILGPGGIGESQFALQFSKYFVIVASLGIPIYGVREVAKVKHQRLKLNKLVSELLILNMITSVISSLIYIIVIACNEKLQANSTLFYIGGLQVLMGFLSIDWLFAGLEDFKIITLRSLTIRLLTIIFLLAFVREPDDVLPYLLISVLSIVLGHIWNLFYALGRVRFIFKTLAFTKHLTPIFLIFLMNGCISMYTIFDTSWVGFLSTSSAVGMYTSAIKLSKIAIPLVTTLGIVLIPRSARAFAANISNPQHLSTSFNFIVDTSVPICVGLFLLSPELLDLFSGHAFMDALWAMRLLSFLPLIIGLSNLFGMQILSASGHDKALLFCVFTGMVLNIVINIWLVPIYAHNGAAIAMFVTEVAVTVATFIAVQTKFKLKFQFMRLLKSFGVSLLFIPCIIVLHNTLTDQTAVILSGILICGTIYIAVQHLLFRNEFIILGMNLFRQKISR